MRAFDVAGIGLALVLVPTLAWLFGRFAGRRDWTIGGLLAATVLLALVVQVDILALLAALEYRTVVGASQDYLYLLGRRIVEAGTSPEFSVFLLIFASFIGMLGWSSTPAQKSA
jgi:hypothetical protein